MTGTVPPINLSFKNCASLYRPVVSKLEKMTIKFSTAPLNT